MSPRPPAVPAAAVAGFLFVLLAPAALAATRYVNASTGVNAGNCTVPASPCKTITYAMGQAASGAPGDAIDVAPGTYNVGLGETFPIVVKSGVQLQSSGGAADTILDAGQTAQVMQTDFDCNASTLIEGFTITGGYNAPATLDARGGGIHIAGGSPTIRGNIIAGNEVRGVNSTFSPGYAYGGGISAFNATPAIVNNVIVSNVSRGGGGGTFFNAGIGYGTGGQLAYGGGIYLWEGGGSIVNNTIYANTAQGGGGGIGVGGPGGTGANGSGGGVYAENAAATVNNNILALNAALGGLGGLGAGSVFASNGTGSYGAMRITGSFNASNNLFHGNTAAGAPSTGDTTGTNSYCYSVTCASVHFWSEPGNLRIELQSPAAGAGTAAGAPAEDLDGVARGAPPSIGAFEASASSTTFNLVLEGWQQVSPYVVTAAGGTGTATYSAITKVLTLALPYSGLGTETGAHIHGPGARGVNAGIVFTLAANSPKNDFFTLNQAQKDMLFAGELYVNIHTAAYPNGEIRAQIDNVGAAVTRVLTVSKAGTGSGTVTGTAEPGQVVNCGSDCTETVPDGKAVALTATPNAGSAFAGWSGACAGTGACNVTMDAAKSVTATFTALIVYNVVLEGAQQSPYVTTPGSGSVTATFNPVSNELTVDLSYSGLSSAETMAHIHGPGLRGVDAGVLHDLYPPTTSPRTKVVTLAAPEVTMLQNGQLYVNVHTTNFPLGEIRGQIDNLGAVTRYTLTINSSSGAGTGTVTGTTEAGAVVNCPGDCTESIPAGKTVTLSAAATGGSTFRGWEDACSSFGTGTCTLTMSAAKSARARFDPPATAQSADMTSSQVVPSSVATGRDLVITASAINNGPATATNVQLRYFVPSGATYIWSSPGCAILSDTVVCTVASLAASASATFKVVIRPTAAGTLDSGAAGLASESDPDSSNNVSAASVNVTTSPPGTPILRYRLYSDVTKEHHFTTDLNEYNVLGTYVGTWVQEGTVGKILNNPGPFGGVESTPYYRLYDNSTRWHHWTTDPNEYYTLGYVFSGWNLEGVDGWILPSQAPGTTQLYRLNYPALGSLHHWTIDANEYSTLISSFGWVGEPGAGFVVQ